MNNFPANLNGWWVQLSLVKLPADEYHFILLVIINQHDLRRYMTLRCLNELKYNLAKYRWPIHQLLNNFEILHRLRHCHSYGYYEWQTFRKILVLGWPSGPPLLHCIYFNPSLDKQFLPYRVRDEITHPFPIFNGGTVDVWDWICNLIPHFTEHVITNPCWTKDKSC